MTNSAFVNFFTKRVDYFVTMRLWLLPAYLVRRGRAVLMDLMALMNVSVRLAEPILFK
jgi:hypothetical protein